MDDCVITVTITFIVLLLLYFKHLLLHGLNCPQSASTTKLACCDDVAMSVPSPIYLRLPYRYTPVSYTELYPSSRPTYSSHPYWSTAVSPTSRSTLVSLTNISPVCLTNRPRLLYQHTTVSPTDLPCLPSIAPSLLIIVMYIDHTLINALSVHMIHVNLSMIFYTPVEHSPTKTTHTKHHTER